MMIKEALRWGNEQLVLTSDSARLDAELLLSHLLKRDAAYLVAHSEQPIDYAQGFPINWWRYKRLISKRRKGMPVAYLTGHKEFYGLDFEVSRHVLVPRPDTEVLVENVIDYFNQNRKPIPDQVQDENRKEFEVRSSKFDFILLDIGTGSACIPISICKHVEDLKAIALDISKKALKVAERNVRKHRLKSRIKLIKSNLLKDLPLELLNNTEVIVTANLPYIPTNFQVNPELKYEPSIALYGGGDGLSLYKKITHQLDLVKPKAIFFELFEDQIAILKTYLPDYKLRAVGSMTGKARLMFMERV